jgi:eukaryotic-like serine/threonine-protein kinase
MSTATIGRYELREEIGRGGMAVVYLAFDPRFKRDVALKVLPRQFTHDPAFVARFQREIEALGTLEHAAIVPIYDFGEENGLPYLVMRHMAGGSLAQRLASGPLPLAEVKTVVARIASALDMAHDKGLIHRDVKPSNILFDPQGYAYLSDFGIVKLAEETISFTGTSLFGTPAYVSPEQVHGEAPIDRRSDVYSLGVVLYEMLAGQPPYRAETPTKQMMAHILNPVPSLPAERDDLSPALDAVVSTALAKDPGERYQTAGELALEAAAALGGAAAAPRPAPQGAPIHEPPPATMPTAPIPAPRRRWLAAGALVLLLAALGVAWAVAGRDRGGPTAIATGDAALAVAAATTTTRVPTPTPPATATDASGVVALVTQTPTRTRTPTPTRTVTPTKAPPLAAGAQSLSAAPSPTPRPRVQAVVPSAAVRRGPGPNYPAFGYLVQNEVADVLARTAGIIWFLVRLADGSEGWVHTGGVILLDDWSVEAVATAAATPTPPLPPTPTPLPPTLTFTPQPTFTVTPSRTPTPCCITIAPPPSITAGPPLPTATACCIPLPSPTAEPTP